MLNDEVQVIILAGGKGTRLKSVIDDIPKPMAKVGPDPFLLYLIKYCKSFGFKNILISTGYRSEIISDYFGNGAKLGVKIEYSHEEKPLGTGGAIKLAMLSSKFKNFICLNVDSFFKLNLRLFYTKSKELLSQQKGLVCLGLKLIQNSERYGSVTLGPDQNILKFSEKIKAENIKAENIKAENIKAENILINSGIYYLEKDIINYIADGFESIESNVFPFLCESKQLFGIEFEGFFIDIGIPEDYFFACKNLDLLVNAGE